MQTERLAQEGAKESRPCRPTHHLPILLTKSPHQTVIVLKHFHFVPFKSRWYLGTPFSWTVVSPCWTVASHDGTYRYTVEYMTVLKQSGRYTLEYMTVLKQSGRYTVEYMTVLKQSGRYTLELSLIHI